MREPVLVAGLQPGGQLTITTDVENYPGFADMIQGPWLMEQMKAQAEHVGTRIISDTIVSVDLAHRPFTLVGDGGDRYIAEALIIATGRPGALAWPCRRAALCRLRRLGVRDLRRLLLPWQKGRRCRRGNTAVEEALFLTISRAR